MAPKLKEKQKSLSLTKTKIDKLEDEKFTIEQELKLYKDNVQHLIDYLANFFLLFQILQGNIYFHLHFDFWSNVVFWNPRIVSL